MKAILQRVNQASVVVENKTVGEIKKGVLVFLGVSNTDTKEHADKLADKIHRIRIFPDENGKTNLSVGDVNSEILIISQFTLYADCRKGTRPSFINAGAPQLAEELYNYFISVCKSKFNKVENGVFGADMKVSLVNDGPFTLILEV